MADPAFSDAQAQVDASNRATLQQLAATGTSGNAAYQGQIDVGNQAKQQALQSTLASAAFSGQGMGAGDATPYLNMIGGAYNQRLGTTADLQAAFSSANALREQGANTFFKEASAALPIIEARTNERVSLARQKALDAAVKKSQDAKASSDSQSKYISQLGGEGPAGAQIAAAANPIALTGIGAANAIAARAGNNGQLTYGTPGVAFQSLPTPENITEAAQNPMVTQGTPLTPTTAGYLAQKYEQGLPKPAAPPSHAQIMGATDYEPAIKLATSMFQPTAPKGGKAPAPASPGDAVAAIMQQYHVSQYVAETIVKDAVARISKQGTIANSAP